MKNEIWKPIKGYEDLYEISSLGHVVSKDRITLCRDGKKRKIRGMPIKGIKANTGYFFVGLRKDNKTELCLIHRLVALHFLEPIEGKTVVNHIDGNKENNNFENLEWCTLGENMQHAWRTHLCHSSELTGGIKSIVKIDPRTGKVLAEYKSITNASKENNISTSGIGSVLSRKKNTSGGFVWRYANEDLSNCACKLKTRPVVQIDKDSNEVIQEFESISAAQHKYASNSNIWLCCKGRRKIAYGYKWKFKDELIKDGKIEE